MPETSFHELECVWPGRDRTCQTMGRGPVCTATVGPKTILFILQRYAVARSGSYHCQLFTVIPQLYFFAYDSDHFYGTLLSFHAISVEQESRHVRHFLLNLLLSSHAQYLAFRTFLRSIIFHAPV